MPPRRRTAADGRRFESANIRPRRFSVAQVFRLLAGQRHARRLAACQAAWRVAARLNYRTAPAHRVAGHHPQQLVARRLVGWGTFPLSRPDLAPPPTHLDGPGGKPQPLNRMIVVDRMAADSASNVRPTIAALLRTHVGSASLRMTRPCSIRASGRAVKVSLPAALRATIADGGAQPCPHSAPQTIKA
jgi:hypothetical protein